MLPWIVLFIAIGLLLAAGIERLIARLGVHRVEPEAGPLATLAERIEQWANERKSKR